MKDITFHLRDEQWLEIRHQIRNQRIAELEKEVEGLKRENDRLQWELAQELPEKPKRCGCGACVRDCPSSNRQWRVRDGGVSIYNLRDGQFCQDCGEELKA